MNFSFMARRFGFVLLRPSCLFLRRGCGVGTLRFADPCVAAQDALLRKTDSSFPKGAGRFS